MGKGDIKSRRGKFFAGSFGKRRPRKKTKTGNVQIVQAVADPEMKVKKAKVATAPKTTEKAEKQVKPKAEKE